MKLSTILVLAFASAASALALSVAPTLAGEFGVSNRYYHESRIGRGVQTVKQTINSQLVENGHTAAVKVVKSSFDGGNGYQDHSVSATVIKGNTHFSQDAHTQIRSTEHYRTNSGSFGHSTGSYFQ